MLFPADPDLDTSELWSDTLKIELQMIFKRSHRNRAVPTVPATVADLRSGEEGILDRIDLPEDIARRLMELGFLPGNTIVPSRTAPGGGARVFQVDGSEVALRHDTARKLHLRIETGPALP